MSVKNRLTNVSAWLMVFAFSLSDAETTVNCTSASYKNHPWDNLVTQQLKAKYMDTKISDCILISKTHDKIIYGYWLYGNTIRKWITCENTNPMPTNCIIN